ncbi:MAG: rhodanese-like domain-containing protein [Desulfobacterales bacterium]|jgi:rubrerythrin/rhodanese-related sulfurtransferase
MDNLEFESLTVAEFRDYVQTQKEKNYLLIDVRRAAEYENGHIPGAKLMPLTDVEARLFTLPSDRDLIFYCANGGRSQWAASLAGEGEVSSKTVYHLIGGVQAWEGKTLSGFPKVKLFDKDQTFEKLLTTAMNLEKGAWRFYEYAIRKFANDSIRPTLKQVSIAEKAHATLIYRFWKKLQHNPPPFDRIYQDLEGEILEGGQNLAEACRHLDAIRNQGCTSVIDFAMTIEYSAFELYRAMADRSENSEAQAMFQSIAQAEKAHMRSLTRAIDQCPDIRAS